MKNQPTPKTVSRRNPGKYTERLKSILSVILETDIPSVADIPIEAIIKMKKLFAVVAGSAPYTPNLSKTGSELFITDARTLLKYLNLLVSKLKYATF